MFNIDRMLEYFHQLPDSMIYIILCLSAFVENVFPPIPGDTITSFGAFLVGTGRLHFFWVYLTTSLGSLAGFMALFFMGKALKRRFFIEKDYKFFQVKDIIKAEHWFHKYGYLIILINRFLPGLRSVISIVSGITQLDTIKVAVLALISTSIWNLAWITVGYYLGTNWETVKQYTASIMIHYNLVIICLLLLGAGALIIKGKFKKRRKK